MGTDYCDYGSPIFMFLKMLGLSLNLVALWSSKKIYYVCSEETRDIIKNAENHFLLQPVRVEKCMAF